MDGIAAGVYMVSVIVNDRVYQRERARFDIP